MSAEDVARYLQDHPDFFESHIDLLESLHIPHPHGGRTISITERQVLSLRDKVKQLEAKLADLIRFGTENDAISSKVHRLIVALAKTEGVLAVWPVLYTHLTEDFAVPHVALRLWGTTKLPDFPPVSEQIQLFATGLGNHPYCGHNTGQEINTIASWFGEAAEHVRSVALIALHCGTDTVGLLALGSEESQRFYAEMDTLYLGRIGELAGAVCGRPT